jgi:hypothetical protein
LISAIFLRGKGKIYKFLRGVMCRHFDLFFLGVKILLTSSIGVVWILNGMALTKMVVFVQRKYKNINTLYSLFNYANL